MEDDRGLRRPLRVATIYDWFQSLAGARYAKLWLAENYWKLNLGDKVIDIGCGPGAVLDYLPDGIMYIGIDISKEYITSAKRRDDPRATFMVGTARDFLCQLDSRLSNAQLVICNGILHHLDDSETLDVLKLARESLQSAGRLVCFEPCYLIHQGSLARWVMKHDRGRNVRSEAEWRRLSSAVFDCFRTRIATNLLRLPYTHIIIECHKRP